jgi:GntR family transcriptional regulator, transcriptional repressor for pyruvate dehydrogenase complex
MLVGPVRPHALNYDVLRYLTDEIVSGSLPVGSLLPSERQLSESLHVSRQMVREALRTLQERGMVEIVPARGTFVREATSVDGARTMEAFYRRSKATARDIVEARSMLEAYSTRLAAVRAETAELSALERCQADIQGTDDPIEGAQFDLTYHWLIAKASHNPVVETMFGSIGGLIFEQMLRTTIDPKLNRKGLPHHKGIIDALRRRDADEAEQQMRAHLGTIRAVYGASYEQRLDSLARKALRSVRPTLSLEALLEDVNRRLRSESIHSARRPTSKTSR